MTTCWRCSSRLDEFGFCEQCDVKGFRASSPRVVVPSGVKFDGVVFRKSGQRLGPETARAGKLVYVEKAGHDLHVFLLHAAIDILVSADRPEPAEPQPEPQRLATYIKG